MRGDETQSQEHQHPSLILLEFCHASPPFSKSHKKIEVKYVRHIRRGLCIFLIQMAQNSQYLIYSGINIFLAKQSIIQRGRAEW